VNSDDRQSALFPLPIPKDPEPRIAQLRTAIWTENKARLIQRYLRYFVFITKHGTYIDGFAGPQEPEKLESWAAKLVLESTPRWLRHFHLVELDPVKVETLRELRRTQPPRDKAKGEPRRDVHIYAGDFNEVISDVLDQAQISPGEAAFCLLDQRTFECKWTTLKRIAGHKKNPSTKIELFYFMPAAWLDRALAATTKNTAIISDWWGRKDWRELISMDETLRLSIVVDRFRSELGYWSVKPWPIRARANGGRTMYYMIHATDHREAPLLMARAYRSAITPLETAEQIALELGIDLSPPRI
jgi:three-Cys-motif partner protein